MSPTLAQLRRYAVARTLFRPTTLAAAIDRLGFVQADPIRAPARAQDLILRHRVVRYRVGDLERAYPRLPVVEDAFVNYGFLPQHVSDLMHPRRPQREWDAAQAARADEVLSFVRTRGVVHPREVDEHVRHGRVQNWFGGTSNAATVALDGLHYRGLLTVAGRDGGTRVYAVAAPRAAEVDPDEGLDRLLDLIVQVYAPLPRQSLTQLASALRYGAPQWMPQRRAALGRLESRVAWGTIAGVDFCWPVDEDPARALSTRPIVRLLAPFDPIVWDRRRFEILWNWKYRFEAYTPAARRVRGYYAMPLLWRDHVIGWGNVAVRGGALQYDLGYVDGVAPGDPRYQGALADELRKMAAFLGCDVAADD